MRLTRILGVAAIALAFFAGQALAQTKPNVGFEKLKTLVGEWDGKTDSGKPVRVSYKLVSGKTALLETLSPADESEMVTVYHPDGDRVMVTHYCSGNNQPRMSAAPSAPPVNQIAFSFVDVTNMANATTGHMQKLEVVFDDNDHFTQRWTWRENGRDQTEVFRYTRKKS